MSEFRMRPKDNYILDTAWDKLYVLTEHWISDLKFYEKDLQFFNKLIDENFIWINEEKHFKEVEKIQRGVLKQIKKCQNLLKSTSRHLVHIKDIIESPFLYDSQNFRKEHQILEDEISAFVKENRKQRKEVFSIIEHVVEKKRLQEVII